MPLLSGTLLCLALSMECRKLDVKSQCKCSVRLTPLPTRLLHPMSFLSRTSGATTASPPSFPNTCRAWVSIQIEVHVSPLNL